MSKRLMGQQEKGSPGTTCFKVKNHSSVLPCLGKVMGAENRIENLGQEGNRSPGNMLQGPLRDPVRARSLTDFETLDGFVNLEWVG